MTRRRHRKPPSGHLRLLPASTAPAAPAKPTVPRHPIEEVLASDHWTAGYLRRMAAQTGGVEQLIDLTDEPLDEQQSAASIDEADAPVRAIADALDGARAEYGRLVDDEAWIIVHRLLGRLAGHRLLDDGDPKRTAAALLWLVLRSGEAGRKRSDAGWVWPVLRVRPAAPRAYALHRALGLTWGGTEEMPPLALPDPALLTSRQRRRLVEDRERALVIYAEHLEDVAAARPMQRRDDGMVLARTRLVRPRWALPGTHDGEQMVLVAFDTAAHPTEPRPERANDDVDEAVSLTVDDAERLIDQLQRAISLVMSSNASDARWFR